MTLLRHRHPTAVIVMLVVVYTATFLLHDLAHPPLPLPSDSGEAGGSLISSPEPDRMPGTDQQAGPGQEQHQCPFCNGFTGSISVSLLPPPAESGGRAAIDAASQNPGNPILSTPARAPPSA